MDTLMIPIHNLVIDEACYARVRELLWPDRLCARIATQIKSFAEVAMTINGNDDAVIVDTVILDSMTSPEPCLRAIINR